MEETNPANPALSPLDATPVRSESETNPPLPALGVLSGLNQTSRERLARFGRYHRFPAGTEVVNEGKRGDCFYVVVSGELAVSYCCCGRNVPLSVAKRGECLGEVSLLEPGPAAATIRVVKDAVLWSMNMEELQTCLLHRTEVAGNMLVGMASCLSSRLRQANDLIAQHHIVPTCVLPKIRESQAITVDNTAVHLGLFDRIKKTLGADKDKKIRISTRIKM
jgi:CRP/FNR family transcriptional regulator, cyclic AMP receptor protein